MIKFKQHHGFTLVELLITISIILMLTGAGIAGFINFNEKQQVQTTVKQVQDLMRAAQIKARAGEGANETNPEKGCLTTENLKGYEVAKDPTLPVVLLNRICVNSSTLVARSTERSSFTLINVNISLDPVTFLALQGGVDTGGSDVTITVSGTYATSNVYEFQVLQTGEITEGSFQ
jgi:prepilin-type N-terminal cleavage/methylation domain-containing protein